MIISKKVSFEAAHFLPNYIGKCHETHGHHWVVELAIRGEVMEDHGFVVDFSRLKDWLQENVVEPFDHELLNEVGIPNPTAENLAIAIRERFSANGWSISGDVSLAWIRVWETPDSMVELDCRR